MRGWRGELSWARRESAPKGSGGASLPSSTLPNSKAKCPIEANAALRRPMDADATINVESMPFSRLRPVAPCDSGLDFKGAGQGRSQTGGVIGAADQYLLLGKAAD
eukprot:395677-Pyramimonas_sp.AAC.1